MLSIGWALPAAAARCYVNAAASGSNSGVTWADAYTGLQSPLANANCSEVWVAQGVYKPVVPVNVGSPTAGERAISFTISRDIAIYGGFAGAEVSLSARDPAARPTILSGDIDNNDDSNNTDGNSVAESHTEIAGSNSRHVVVMNGLAAGVPITTNTVLDGFTLTGGDNTNASPPTEAGGALWCKGNGAGHACSPTLARLVVSGNRANSGGGMAFIAVSGGASSPALRDVFFRGNTATTFGGAMFNYAEGGGVSSPTLTNVTFSSNSSALYGGALVNDGTSAGNSSPTLINVTFTGNSASQGGAMFNNGAGTGGVSSPTVFYATFSGNSASGNGGAIYSSGPGGGSSTPELNRVILWGNTATLAGPEVFHNSASTTMLYGIIAGGCQANMSCGSLTDGDPLLGPLANNGGYTPTMMPGPGSAAINAMVCFMQPATDQRDMPRPDPPSAALQQGCDLGAVEVGSYSSELVFGNGFETPQLH